MIDGIIYAAQYLVIARDEPFLAEEMMRESGFSKPKLIAAQKLTGYETVKMNKVINAATK
jgi:hypothetical protein